MLSNHLYNLMLQLVEENKSLWRIEEEYENDADDCKECLDFWKQMKKIKEEDIKKLQELINKHNKH